MEGDPEADPRRSGWNVQLAPGQKAWESLPTASPKWQPRPATLGCRTQVQHITRARAPGVGGFLTLAARHLLLQVTEHLTQTGLRHKEIHYTSQNWGAEAGQSSLLADLEAQQSGPHYDFHCPWALLPSRAPFSTQKLYFTNCNGIRTNIIQTG